MCEFAADRGRGVQLVVGQERKVFCSWRGVDGSGKQGCVRVCRWQWEGVRLVVGQEMDEGVLQLELQQSHSIIHFYFRRASAEYLY